MDRSWHWQETSMARVITVMWDGEWRRTTTILPQFIYLHNTSTNPFEFLRIGDFCSRCYVRVMYCSSNSLFAQHMHKTFHQSDKSAAGFVWGICAVATQTIYCTTLPQTLEFSKNLALLFCSRFHVRYVLLLLKQSIAQHFQKPFEFSKNWKLMHQMLCDLCVLLLKSSLLHNTSRNPFELSKNWTLSAADDVVWAMCCYWNNNLLHITSTNPLSSPRIGN
jgi:hypothetical protein